MSVSVFGEFDEVVADATNLKQRLPQTPEAQPSLRSILGI
jgi:hypothetical protein